LRLERKRKGAAKFCSGALFSPLAEKRSYQHRPGESPDWIICGGESGPGARRMKPKWAWALRDECADLGIPFFMEQIGSNHDRWPAKIRGKGDDISEWPEDLRVRQFPSGEGWSAGNPSDGSCKLSRRGALRSKRNGYVKSKYYLW
jgi:hypothetical protein